MKDKRWIFGVILWGLLLLTIPAAEVFAQSGFHQDDFIVTLALMAVADDRLDGVMDVSALSDIRAVLDEYYTQKGFLHMDPDTSQALSEQKTLILTALDKKITHQKELDYRGRLALFGDMTDSADDFYKKYKIIEGEPESLLNMVLSGGLAPDPQLKTMLQQRLADSTQASLEDSLNGQIVASVPDGDEVISRTTDQVYEPRAGSGEGASQEIVGIPLSFVNAGSRDVHVIIEYYEPPRGLAISAPGLSLNVGGDSSVLVDGFPQGNYVFCIDWESNLDTNDDGIKDYDRAVIHDWVSSGMSDSIYKARKIYVRSSFSETPSGRCEGFKGEAPSTETVMHELAMREGDPAPNVRVESTDDHVPMQEVYPPQTNESDQDYSAQDDEGAGADFWDQGDGDKDTGAGDPLSGSGLTPAEQSNQGAHQYQMTCENEELGDTSTFSATWTFSEDGVTGGNGFYARIGPNVYRNDYPTTITFTSSGYLVESSFSETSSEGVTTTSSTYCTATRQ